MTISNLNINGQFAGGMLTGEHGATNQVDDSGKQQGLTGVYSFEGYRDASQPTIAFLKAYIGSHGDVTPIETLAFDVLDDFGVVCQHVVMRACVCTAWTLESPQQPDEGGTIHPDREFIRLESNDVELHSGGDVKRYKKQDVNI